MPSANNPHDDAKLLVSSSSSPQPAQPAHFRAQTLVANVLDITSLNADAGQPARVSNLSHSNLTSSVGRSAQNAVANQQAHAQLNLALVGKVTNQLQNVTTTEARSSVDVITDNSLAEAISALKASVQALGPGPSPRPYPPPPFDWKRILKALQRVLAEIAEIEKVNNRVSGDGSMNAPYTGSPLYIQASVTLGFRNLLPPSLDLEIINGRLHAATPLAARP